jgi:hypothetical protein
MWARAHEIAHYCRLLTEISRAQKNDIDCHDVTPSTVALGALFFTHPAAACATVQLIGLANLCG